MTVKGNIFVAGASYQSNRQNLSSRMIKNRKNVKISNDLVLLSIQGRFKDKLPVF